MPGDARFGERACGPHGSDNGRDRSRDEPAARPWRIAGEVRMPPCRVRGRNGSVRGRQPLGGHGADTGPGSQDPCASRHSGQAAMRCGVHSLKWAEMQEAGGFGARKSSHQPVFFSLATFNAASTASSTPRLVVSSVTASSATRKGAEERAPSRSSRLRISASTVS